MLSAKLVTDTESLSALHSLWGDLLARSRDNEICLHPSWMRAWWSVFGCTGKRSLRTVAIFDTDRLIGLAPLHARPYVYRPGIPFRRLETLGSGEDAADETCGDYLGVVAETGREREVAFSVAGAVAAGDAGTWDELLFSSMNGDSPLPALLHDAFRSHGLRVALEEWSSAPYVPLPGTWEDYLSALKSSKRSLLRKALRSFETWAGGEPSIFFVQTAEQLPEARRVLETLHRERWGSSGVFASPKFCAFHDRLMPELLQADALDLGWISVRGEPVAAFYNFRWNGRVSFYQSGRRLDTPDDVRVGVAMHAYLIRDAIRRGLKEYDFMAGSSQYKMSFALASRPLVRLRVARPSIAETVRVATVGATTWARRLRSQGRRRVAEPSSTHDSSRGVD